MDNGKRHSSRYMKSSGGLNKKDVRENTGFIEYSDSSVTTAISGLKERWMFCPLVLWVVGEWPIMGPVLVPLVVVSVVPSVG